MTESLSAEQKQKFSLWMIASMILAVIGAAVSGYATYHDIQVAIKGFTDSACNINQTFSCDTIAASEYSEFFGVPVGVWGVGYFICLFFLAFLMQRSQKISQGHLQTYGVIALSGVLTSIALAYVSIFVIQVGCINCIGVYLINCVQILLLIINRSFFKTPLDPKGVSRSLVNCSIAVAILVGGFKVAGFEAKDQVIENSKNPLVPRLSTTAVEIPLSNSRYSGNGEDYSKGNKANPSVIIHKFSDFQCPACKRMALVLSQISKDFGNKVQIVYRNYPLDSKCNGSMQRQLHPAACEIALLARCAGLHGKFWQYHDLAFLHQSQSSKEDAKSWAQEIGLSEKEIENCKTDESILDKIKDDVSVGNSIGVTATPTLYLNGKKFLGGGREALKEEVRKILDQS